MARLRGWLQIIGVVLFLLLLLVAATAYTLTAIIYQTGVTWPVFFSLLAVLAATNAWLLLLVWRRRDTLSPLVHVACILWGGVAIWYWTFAPLYYVLNMHLNAHQLAWTTFAFLWEVPVIGGGVLTTLGVLLFRAITRDQSSKAYTRAIQYPRRIAVLLFCLSVIGYIIGAIQLDLFASVSGFELAKSVLNGPIVSVFLAVFFYLTLDTYLDQLRRRLAQHLPYKSWPHRHLRRRLAIVSLAVLLGGVGLLGLLVVESFQRLTEQRLSVEMQEDLARLRQATAAPGPVDLQTFARGANGRIVTLATDEVGQLRVSAETKTALAERDEGIVTDLHEQGKMLAFITPRPNYKVVSVAYLTGFYDFLRWPEFVSYLLGSLLVIILTTGIFMFVVYEITRALTSLRLLAQNPKLSHWNELVGVHTGDEIEAVGRSFMRHVQKAREVDKVKQEFVSLASHQLRTPLTAIRWYVEILAEQQDGPLTKKQQHYLARINRGALRMIQLVNSLLNVSRIDSGRLVIKPQEIDLVEFMRQLIDEIAPHAKQAECKFQVNDDLERALTWVDPMILRQVLQNLFTNALKYKLPDRTCIILVALSRDAAQHFLITVKDNGVGIPSDQQHRVFDRFFRADNVATLDTEGTGLGLYVSKMLLDAAGCDIKFTSEEGRGTEFQITIPQTGMLAKPGEIGLVSDPESLDNPSTKRLL